MLILIFGISAYAHSGNTDGSGGHYDNSTGDYHYHHGLPAHRHPNGKCPYSNNTQNYSNGSSGSGSSNDNGSQIGIFFACLIILLLFPLWIGIFGKIKEFFSPKKNNTNNTTSNQTQKVESNDTNTTKNSIQDNSFSSVTFSSPSPDNTKISKNKDSNMFTISYNTCNRTTPSPTPQKSTDNEELSRLKKQIAALKMENSKLNEELIKVTEKLSKEKQREVKTPCLQDIESTPECLRIKNIYKYNEALASEKNDKALSGNLVIKQVTADIYSHYSGETYHTTINSCDCGDFIYNRKHCKHMLAFAFAINAIPHDTL